MSRKIISLVLSLCFIFQQTGFVQAAAVELNLSGYFARMASSMDVDKFRPVHLRYFSYDSLNNSFKVLLDKGDSMKGLSPQGTDPKQTEQQLKEETKELLKYFLIGVTLPNDKFWVNLRPDSPSQIIDFNLEETDIGKIMLEADLQLKKDTAAFTSPQTPEGKEYWNRLYKKAEEIYGTENITIPTLTRPWIVPNEIIVRETKDSAYIYKATLKVMLEQDYLKDSATYSFKDERSKALNEYSSQLIRELIIPKLTKEVNLSKRYAPLRQVYYSLILSRWFKSRFYGKSGVYASLIDKNDLINLTSKTDWSKTTYFNAYKKSFAQGEYNIKEPVYTPSGQTIRSYFSGGMRLLPPVSEIPNAGGFTGASPVLSKTIERTLTPVLGNSQGALEIGGQISASAIKPAAASPVSQLTPLRLLEEILRLQKIPDLQIQARQSKQQILDLIRKHLPGMPDAKIEQILKYVYPYSDSELVYDYRLVFDLEKIAELEESIGKDSAISSLTITVGQIFTWEGMPDYKIEILKVSNNDYVDVMMLAPKDDESEAFSKFCCLPYENLVSLLKNLNMAADKKTFRDAAKEYALDISAPSPEPVVSSAISKKTLSSYSDDYYKGKVVEMRVDFNVPIKDGVVQDDSRIRAVFDTLEYLTKRGAKVLLTSHLGRPQKEFKKIVAELYDRGHSNSEAERIALQKLHEQFTLAPVAKRLQELAAERRIRVLDFDANLFTTRDAKSFILRQMKNGEAILLENLRLPTAEEAYAKAPDANKDFADALFEGVDIFVNDAFAVSHRVHASVVGAPKGIPRLAGILMQREIASTDRDFKTAVMGGIKVLDKIKVIKALLGRVDRLLIGGAMANAFFKAGGMDVGNSVGADEEDVKIAKSLLNDAALIDPKTGKSKLVLPVDAIIAENFSDKANYRVITIGKDAVPDGWMVVDIGPKTIVLYDGYIQDEENAIFWNGPMGAFDKVGFAGIGTASMAKSVSQAKAETVAGGGDSLSAIKRYLTPMQAELINHISTAGGAYLEYIEKGSLPGIEALSDASSLGGQASSAVEIDQETTTKLRDAGLTAALIETGTKRLAQNLGIKARIVMLPGNPDVVSHTYTFNGYDANPFAQRTVNILYGKQRDERGEYRFDKRGQITVTFHDKRANLQDVVAYDEYIAAHRREGAKGQAPVGQIMQAVTGVASLVVELAERTDSYMYEDEPIIPEGSQFPLLVRNHYKDEFLVWALKKDNLGDVITVELDSNTAAAVKFGTSGERGTLDDPDRNKRFSVQRVLRVAQGISDYYNNQKLKGEVTIGYDTRALSREYAYLTAAVLAGNGIKVRLTESATPVPVVAFGVAISQETDKPNAGGIIVTASHNPWEYNGIKWVIANGGAAPANVTNLIQSAAKEAGTAKIIPIAKAVKTGLVKIVDLKQAYIDYILSRLPEDAKKKLREWGSNPHNEVRINPMQGSGIGYLWTLLASKLDFTNAREINIQIDRMFGQVNNVPNPDYASDFDLDIFRAFRSGKNVVELFQDADADRFGVRDVTGERFTANELIPLLKALLREKGYKGAIAKTLVTSNFANIVDEADGEVTLETDTGFKGLVGPLESGKYLVVGEESAHVGISLFKESKDDGIAVGLMALWIIAEKGSITGYKKEIESKIGTHTRYKRIDTLYSEKLGLEKKGKAMVNLINLPEANRIVQENNGRFAFDYAGNEEKFTNLEIISNKIQRVAENNGGIARVFICYDSAAQKSSGYKILFGNGNVAAIRVSGTGEPTIRLYVEVTSKCNLSTWDDVNTQSVDKLRTFADETREAIGIEKVTERIGTAVVYESDIGFSLNATVNSESILKNIPTSQQSLEAMMQETLSYLRHKLTEGVNFEFKIVKDNHVYYDVVTASSALISDDDGNVIDTTRVPSALAGQAQRTSPEAVSVPTPEEELLKLKNPDDRQKFRQLEQQGKISYRAPTELRPAGSFIISLGSMIETESIDIRDAFQTAQQASSAVEVNRGQGAGDRGQSKGADSPLSTKELSKIRKKIAEGLQVLVGKSEVSKKVSELVKQQAGLLLNPRFKQSKEAIFAYFEIFSLYAENLANNVPEDSFKDAEIGIVKKYVMQAIDKESENYFRDNPIVGSKQEEIHYALWDLIGLIFHRCNEDYSLFVKALNNIEPIFKDLAQSVKMGASSAGEDDAKASLPLKQEVIDAVREALSDNEYPSRAADIVLKWLQTSDISYSAEDISISIRALCSFIREQQTGWLYDLMLAIQSDGVEPQNLVWLITRDIEDTVLYHGIEDDDKAATIGKNMYKCLLELIKETNFSLAHFWGLAEDLEEAVTEFGSSAASPVGASGEHSNLDILEVKMNTTIENTLEEWRKAASIFKSLPEDYTSDYDDFTHEVLKQEYGSLEDWYEKVRYLVAGWRDSKIKNTSILYSLGKLAEQQIELLSIMEERISLKNNDFLTVLNIFRSTREEIITVNKEYLVAWQTQKTKSNSPKENGSSPLGGIDFKHQAMASATTYEAMGSFSGLDFSLPKLSSQALLSFNLDKEQSDISRAIDNGIIVSGQRIKEFMAASAVKGELEQRRETVIIWLAKLGILEETICCTQESSKEYREALVIADSAVI